MPSQSPLLFVVPWQLEVVSQLFTGIVDGAETYIDDLPVVLYRKLTSPRGFW